MAWEGDCLGVGFMVVGIMNLRGGTMYRELVRIRDFCFPVLFFYNHILLVKVMNVIILQCDHMLTFLCGV